jgi:hypothetical protein
MAWILHQSRIKAIISAEIEARAGIKNMICDSDPVRNKSPWRHSEDYGLLRPSFSPPIALAALGGYSDEFLN